MTHSEVTFNYKMLHPCLEATVDLLYHASYPEPYYAPGEESIEAMIQQLVLINSKIERRKVYNANGIIRLCDFMILKFSCWRRQAVSRTRTREKSAPITAEACSPPPPLAMLKSVGNRFSRVSPETFQKLNLYFVQASGKKANKKKITNWPNPKYRWTHSSLVSSVCQQWHL